MTEEHKSRHATRVPRTMRWFGTQGARAERTSLSIGGGKKQPSRTNSTREESSEARGKGDGGSWCGGRRRATRGIGVLFYYLVVGDLCSPDPPLHVRPSRQWLPQHLGVEGSLPLASPASFPILSQNTLYSCPESRAGPSRYVDPRGKKHFRRRACFPLRLSTCASCSLVKHIC